MSIGLLGLLASIITGVIAYIQYLRMTIESHQTTIAMLTSQSKEKEWKDEINKATKDVQESEIDYAKSRDSFHDKYGNGKS